MSELDVHRAVPPFDFEELGRARTRYERRRARLHLDRASHALRRIPQQDGPDERERVALANVERARDAIGAEVER